MRSAAVWAVAAVVAGGAAVAAALRPFVVTVEGASMEPALHDGDRVLAVGGWLRRRAGEGDIVAIRAPWADDPAASHAPALMVKRLARRGPGTVRYPFDRRFHASGGAQGWPVRPGAHVEAFVPRGTIFVLSDDEEHGLDSRLLGPIDRSDIVGRVGGSPLRVSASPRAAAQEAP